MFKPNNKILATGAHPDDIEISCGGTIAKLINEYNCIVEFAVFANGELKTSAKTRMKEQDQSCMKLGVKKIHRLGLKDGEIGFSSREVMKLEEICNSFNPDVIFTHTLNDHHQDHINVGKITMAATRHTSVDLITYPSLYSKVNQSNNLVVDVSNYVNLKMGVVDVFRSQIGRLYTNKDWLLCKMRASGYLFGFEYAEEFEIKRSYVK